MKRCFGNYWATLGIVSVIVHCDPVAARVTFEWISVGHPANAPDPLNVAEVPGIGAVAYNYRIARHEVTNSQYAAFLNAIAQTDINGLFSPVMESSARGGIVRLGSVGGYSYAVKPHMGDKPVNFVSYFDAMRFVNWLHNNQPSGAQDETTTEEGVYTISNGLSESRALDARFFIPTENEWYKAAYHHPAADGGDADDFWLYPTASNRAPTLATADANGNVNNAGTNVANCEESADWNGQDGNVTSVGSAGPGSASFYGTADQGGNLLEWTDQTIDGAFRVFRGGSWKEPESFLQSTSRHDFIPALEGDRLGFRIAAPATPSEIPTTSAWGFSVMTLVMATAGTLVYGVQGSPTPEPNPACQIIRRRRDARSHSVARRCHSR